MNKEIQIFLLITVLVFFVLILVQASLLATQSNAIKSLTTRLKAEENFSKDCNGIYINRCKELRDEYQEALKFIRDTSNKENQQLQYRIDNLMLEYCPEEMTVPQYANYAAHQKKVDPDFNLVLPNTPEEDKQIQDIENIEEIKNECS